MLIYVVTNKVNDKKYIGQTSQSLKQRKNHHIRSAILKRYDTHFHRALIKHGFDSFTWEVLERCNNREELNEREKYYIDKFDTFVNGYNMSLGGLGHSNIGGKSHPMYGKHHSDRTKAKLREFNTGKKLSQETKNKIGGASVGRKHTTETKNKLSAIHKGKVIPQDIRDKISATKKGTMTGTKNPFYGKKHNKTLQEEITYKQSLDWFIIFPDGKTKRVRNLAKFCRDNGLTPQRMYDVAAGKLENHKFFKCFKCSVL